MTYQITEEEISRVQCARAQLRMVCDLLSASNTAMDVLCRPGDLYEFISAQVDALTVVLDATEQRWKKGGNSDLT
jgi:hypothetical protein